MSRTIAINIKEVIQAYNLYAQNKSYADIASIMRIHNLDYVEKMVDRGEQMKTALELRGQELTWEEVGKRVGVSAAQAHYLAKCYAKTTGKKIPDGPRNLGIMHDVYALLRKGYSQSLILSMGLKFTDKQVYAYCYNHKLPRIRQDQVLQQDPRWSVLANGWQSNAVNPAKGQVLEKCASKQCDYTLRSYSDAEAVWIELERQYKDGSLKHEVTRWALSPEQVQEDQKYSQRPNWSVACDAVSLYLKTCLEEETSRKKEAQPESPQSTRAPAQAVEDVRAPALQASEDLTTKLFKHAVNSLDVTDPKSRKYLKDMLEMFDSTFTKVAKGGEA